MIKRSDTVFIDNAPLFTDPQLASFAELFRNTGLLILGAIVIPYVFGSVWYY